MPKGIYEKTRLYRKTSKLTEALTTLKTQDPYFQVSELMTNEDIFLKLKEFGFVYRQGHWRLPIRAKAQHPTNGSNGLFNQKPLRFVQLDKDEKEVTIKPVGVDRLEMCLSEEQLDTLQNVIEAMHTLGFKVDVKIIGTR